MNFSTDWTHGRIHYNRISLTFVDRLRESINPDTVMFDWQLRLTRWDVTCGSEAITMTNVCLIAVQRAGLGPETLSIDPELTRQSLIRMAGEQDIQERWGS